MVVRVARARWVRGVLGSLGLVLAALGCDVGDSTFVPAPPGADGGDGGSSGAGGTSSGGSTSGGGASGSGGASGPAASGGGEGGTTGEAGASAGMPAVGGSTMGADGGPEDAGPDSGDPAAPTFALRVLATGLGAPWEITWGPDQMLWVTERTAGRVLRISPADGTVVSELAIAEVAQAAGQDGLLGLALHPELTADPASPYLYVAYTYEGETSADAGAAIALRAKVRRYTVDLGAGTFSAPLDLIADLPASEDHNSGRLVFGPDQRLYYTVGDQGHNQFSGKCRPIRSQELPTEGEVSASDYAKYAGKILRLELDGSIPEDNPVLAGARSHIYSYGHRNAQGLVFTANGNAYAAEHGPKSDDELNLILPGMNYGWPDVSGHRDDLAYVYGNWSASAPTPCDELEYSDYVIPESVPTALESEFDAPDFVAPLATYYTVPDDYTFVDPACGGNDYICWPTLAPSSLDVYPSGGAVPGWGGSLLMSSLKQGALYRVPLAAGGLSVSADAEPVVKTQNRYRDLAIQPSGAVIYVVTDPSGALVGPEGGYSTASENPGAILEFTYLGGG